MSLKEIPVEIVCCIFDFLIFNLYNVDYIDFNEKSNIDKYLLVSRNFNILFVKEIIYVFNNYFNIHIINGESCRYNFWRNFLRTLLIEKMEMIDEISILDNEHNKMKNNNKRKNIMVHNNNEFIKNRRKLFFADQRINFFDEFLKRNMLYTSFRKTLLKLVIGKELFRKHINKKNKYIFNINELKNIFKKNKVYYKTNINIVLLIKNFEYFYIKYIKMNYEYKPRSIMRKRILEDCETKENKRIKLKDKILQEGYKKTSEEDIEINNINHLIKKKKKKTMKKVKIHSIKKKRKNDEINNNINNIKKIKHNY
jgi:hypothetical protein